MFKAKAAVFQPNTEGSSKLILYLDDLRIICIKNR